MCFNFSLQRKGYLSVLGGILLNIVLGSFYLWGTLNIYVVSYFKLRDSSFKLENTLFVFPLMSFATHLAAPLSVKVCEKIGFRVHLSICLLCVCLSHFLAFYTETFIGFLMIYGILFGLFSGFAYLIPLYNAYKYFPLHRGLIAGFVLGAYGIGSMITGTILMLFLNYENEGPIYNEHDGAYYFSSEISERLPSSLQTLAGFFLLFGVIGIALCFEYEDEEESQKQKNLLREDSLQDMVMELKINESESEIEKKPQKSLLSADFSLKNSRISMVKISRLARRLKTSMFHSKIGKWSMKTINFDDETKCNTLIEGLKSSLFYKLVFLMMFSSSGCFFLVANFKNLGIISIHDDGFLNIVGFVGALCNGFGRLLWGFLFDKYKFHKTFAIVLVVELFIQVFLKLSLNSPTSYFICCVLGFFCLGGHPVLFPSFTIQSFGANVGSIIYGFVFFGFFMGNLLQTLIAFELKEKAGFDNLGFVFLGGIAICFGVLIFSKLKF